VRVKSGVKDVDFEGDIGGWQGRVVEVKEGSIMVAWDSHTLLHDVPPETIAECEKQGLDWTCHVFILQELESAEARDTPADVRQAVDELTKRHAWDWLGEEGKLVREVLQGIDPDDEFASMGAWYDYMEEHLTFPFEAEIDEFQERSPLQSGDRVRVYGLTDADEFYGVIVRLRKGREKYHFPLCDLEALDEDSENYAIIRSYRVWFANR
jgi:hypothetical protein